MSNDSNQPVQTASGSVTPEMLRSRAAILRNKVKTSISETIDRGGHWREVTAYEHGFDDIYEARKLEKIALMIESGEFTY